MNSFESQCFQIAYGDDGDPFLLRYEFSRLTGCLPCFPGYR